MGRMKDLFFEEMEERMMEEHVYEEDYFDWDYSDNNSNFSCDGECLDCPKQDCSNSIFDRD